jgi:hypothetical protein
MRWRSGVMNGLLERYISRFCEWIEEEDMPQGLEGVKEDILGMVRGGSSGKEVADKLRDYIDWYSGQGRRGFHPTEEEARDRRDLIQWVESNDTLRQKPYGIRYEQQAESFDYYDHDSEENVESRAIEFMSDFDMSPTKEEKSLSDQMNMLYRSIDNPPPGFDSKEGMRRVDELYDKLSELRLSRMMDLYNKSDNKEFFENFIGQIPGFNPPSLMDNFLSHPHTK